MIQQRTAGPWFLVFPLISTQVVKSVLSAQAHFMTMNWNQTTSFSGKPLYCHHSSSSLFTRNSAFYTLLSLNLILQHKYCSITTVPCVQAMSPTRACCVHSNVYGLGNIYWIQYLTAVDPILSTSSTVQTYHHLISVSVEISIAVTAENSSSIEKEPVP